MRRDYTQRRQTGPPTIQQLSVFWVQKTRPLGTQFQRTFLLPSNTPLGAMAPPPPPKSPPRPSPRLEGGSNGHQSGWSGATFPFATSSYTPLSGSALRSPQMRIPHRFAFARELPTGVPAVVAPAGSTAGGAATVAPLSAESVAGECFLEDVFDNDNSSTISSSC